MTLTKIYITPISQLLLFAFFILLVVATNAATFAAIKMTNLNYLVFILLIGLNLLLLFYTFSFYKMDKDKTYIYLIEMIILCELEHENSNLSL
jgi:hypothetical protein